MEKIYQFFNVNFVGQFNRGKFQGFVFLWAAKGIGFGELSFYKSADQPVTQLWDCYSECMSDEFVRQTLRFFLEKKVRKAKNRRWCKKRFDSRFYAERMLGDGFVNVR